MTYRIMKIASHAPHPYFVLFIPFTHTLDSIVIMILHEINKKAFYTIYSFEPICLTTHYQRSKVFDSENMPNTTEEGSSA